MPPAWGCGWAWECGPQGSQQGSVPSEPPPAPGAGQGAPEKEDALWARRQLRTRAVLGPVA